MGSRVFVLMCGGLGSGWTWEDVAALASKQAHKLVFGSLTRSPPQYMTVTQRRDEVAHLGRGEVWKHFLKR